jgi:hypothetical protein
MQQTTTRTYAPSLSRATYKPRIQHLGHGLYRVQSASQPDTAYIVDSQDNPMTCTCPAGAHGRRCWHVAKVTELVICRERETHRAEFRELAEAFAGLSVPTIDIKAQRGQVERAAAAKPVYTGPRGMAALDDAFGPLNLPA